MRHMSAWFQGRDGLQMLTLDHVSDIFRFILWEMHDASRLFAEVTPRNSVKPSALSADNGSVQIVCCSISVDDLEI